jgi:hypothetical protein
MEFGHEAHDVVFFVRCSSGLSSDLLAWHGTSRCGMLDESNVDFAPHSGV